MNYISDVKQPSGIQVINRFLASPLYVVLIMGLSAVANIFQAELPVYTLYTATAVYTCLFGADLSPLMPIVLACYIAPSAANNPGNNANSVFSGASGIYITLLAACIAGAVLYRIIRQPKGIYRGKYKLLLGLVLLCAGYMLSGIGSAAYPDSLAKNLLFALIQSVSLLFPYWLFSRYVDWKAIRADYMAWIGLSLGIAMAAQILGICLFQDVFINGVIWRVNFYTGWGMANNIAFMQILAIPSAFYIALHYRRAWVGPVLGVVFMAAACMTYSRNAILFGTLIYIVCALLTLRYTPRQKSYRIVLLGIALLVVAVFLVFHKQLARVFSVLLYKGLGLSHRDEFLKEGMKLFSKWPIFGCSFFSPGFQPWDWATLDSFSSFFPPRWHSTFIQLFASCGLVGVTAYGFHRVQTILVFWKKRKKENIFLHCTVFIILACSLLDSHFFNVGPTLFYSMLLAFNEHCPEEINI